jgi:RNA polymerase-binding protein DksA
MSALDTDRFRERLQEERRRVQAAIQNLHDENPGSIEDDTDDQPSDNHLAETATVTYDRELDNTLEENSERVLAEIDAALERIEGGTFGTCEKCGKPIGDERLEALPYATQCIDCKRKEE